MRINFQREQIPWVMAAGRGVLGPVLIAGAACSWNGVTLAGIVVAALISDIYDGVLARRWSCDTAGVRLFDSMADTVFYLCTALALWIRLPQVWRSYWGLLVALLALEVARFALDFAKFGKPASYHSYLAKGWGLVMAVAVVAAFAMHRGSVLVPVALGMGILCDLEGLAMSWVMPLWRKDVKTIGAALQFRGDQMGKGLQRGTHRWRERRRVIFTAFLGMVVSAVFVSSAFAVQDGQVAYAGGTIRRNSDQRDKY